MSSWGRKNLTVPKSMIAGPRSANNIVVWKCGDSNMFRKDASSQSTFLKTMVYIME
jgi:hypothetical protein